jgi:hypothetical protein
MQSLRTLGPVVALLSMTTSLPALAEPATSPPPGEEPAATVAAPSDAQAAEQAAVDPSARWANREIHEPRDTLTNHFVAGGSVSYALPFGTVSDGVDQRDRVGTGLGYGLDLGYGLSGHVVAGVWGQLLTLGDGNDCSSNCDATSYAGGAFVRYHLVQGLRFDPWLSFGIGYRSQSSNSFGEKKQYGGLDWARLQIGGDWYALSQLGFGPVLELGAGSFFSRPEEESAGGVHWRFLVGLRVVADFPGK